MLRLLKRTSPPRLDTKETKKVGYHQLEQTQIILMEQLKFIE